MTWFKTTYCQLYRLSKVNGSRTTTPRFPWAGFIPEYNWLATGGRSGVNDRIFLDVDAYDYWKEKFKARPKLEIYISDFLQRTAT